MPKLFGSLFCISVLCAAPASAGGAPGSCNGLKGTELSRCEEQEALRSLKYGSEEYKKAKLTCAICDDMRRAEARPSGYGRTGRGGGNVFVNKRLEDDLLRYQATYGEHFKVKRCREQETKELCRKYRIVADKQKKESR